MPDYARLTPPVHTPLTKRQLADSYPLVLWYDDRAGDWYIWAQWGRSVPADLRRYFTSHCVWDHSKDCWRWVAHRKKHAEEQYPHLFRTVDAAGGVVIWCDPTGEVEPYEGAPQAMQSLGLQRIAYRRSEGLLGVYERSGIHSGNRSGNRSHTRPIASRTNYQHLYQ